jgi:hypothetical protein
MFISAPVAQRAIVSMTPAAQEQGLQVADNQFEAIRWRQAQVSLAGGSRLVTPSLHQGTMHSDRILSTT